MRKITKFILGIMLAVVSLWGVTGIIDYSKIKEFKKPIFAIPTNTYDDGGSGTYQGLGYSFEIEGNFLPDDEQPGVTYYEYYILGNLMDTRTRK